MTRPRRDKNLRPKRIAAAFPFLILISLILFLDSMLLHLVFLPAWVLKMSTICCLFVYLLLFVIFLMIIVDIIIVFVMVGDGKDALPSFFFQYFLYKIMFL